MEKQKNNEIEKDNFNINRLIEKVENFKNEHWYAVTSNSTLLNGRQAKIYHSEGGLHFEIAIVEPIPPEHIEAIMGNKQIWFEFSNDWEKLYASYQSFQTFEANYALARGYATFKGKFQQLIALGQTLVEQKFTAVIECSEPFSLGSFFPATALKVGQRFLGGRIFEIIVKDQPMQIYLYGRENTDENFLFIESMSGVNYKSFVEIVHETLLTIAFFTGVFAGKEIFISNTASEKLNKEMISSMVYSENIRSTKLSAIPKLSDHIVEHNVLQIKNGLNCLSSMIEMCLNSPSFRRTILIMLKANSQPDYTKVVLYSVALEAMAKLIYEQNEDVMNIVSDRAIGKEIRTKLKASLRDFQGQIEEKTFKKLDARLDNINSPSNKDMLTKPFSLYGIELNEADLEAINNRNDFLHGRLTSEAGSHELSIISLRLHFCVNALILKYVGYEGGALYQPWFYQRHHKLAVNCSPVVLI